MNIRRVSLVAFSLLLVCLSTLRALSQQTGSYPAFTLMTQVTDYDAKGRNFPTLTEMRYNSAKGDWRYVGTYAGGQVVETIYRQGSGVYFPDLKNGRLLKVGEVCNGQPRAVRGAALRADAKFVRTEMVLGYTAYVHRESFAGYVMETYFVPQFGYIPFKRVMTFQNGGRRVEEPLSATLGEPDVSLVKGTDYPVFEEVLAWNRNDLSGQAQRKPDPIYPPEAQALGIKGLVTVQIYVDKTGEVVAARVASIPIPLLDEAAMNAAYQAHFNPTLKDGRPVLSSGIVTYKFNF